MGEQQPSPRNTDPALSWMLLLVLSAGLAYLLQLVHFPAAVLLGSMLAGVIIAVRGANIRLPRLFFQIAQSFIGVMIAQRMTPDFMAEAARSWFLFVVGVLWAIVAAAVLGLLLTRKGVFPGTTAIWGLSPGAASTMTIMSEYHGGDIRLVAFMQYLRIITVVIVTSLVARFWIGVPAAAPARAAGPTPGPWPILFALLLAAVSVIAARKFKQLPAGPILVPFFLGLGVNSLHPGAFVMPPWLVAITSLLLGWSIGLRFDRPIIKQAARAFPWVFASILVLILLCGAYAAAMSFFAGIDPFTAYLAASPGGVDSVALIAASADVSIPFVMAMQTARLILVIAIGPFLARFLVRKAYPGVAPGADSENREGGKDREGEAS